jgi:hypothetical protein
MIIGYIRVSTDRQAADNQRFEILKFADEKKWAIDEWVEEAVSGTRNVKDRKLGSQNNPFCLVKGRLSLKATITGLPLTCAAVYAAPVSRQGVLGHQFAFCSSDLPRLFA